MLKNSLVRFGKELGLQKNGDKMCGVYDGYFVAFCDSTIGSSMIFDVYFSMSENVKKEKIKSFISSSATYYQIAHVDIKNTVIRIDFGSGSSFGMFRDYLFAMVSELKAENVAGADICSNCGNSVDKINIVSVSGYFHTCCSECAKKIKLAGAISVTDSASRIKSHLGIGIFGSLLGAIVGGIAWITADRINLFPAFTGIVIALFSMLGYTLFAGTANGGKTASVILCSFFSIIVSEYLSLCRMLAQLWTDSGYVFEKKEIFTSVFNTVISDSAALEKILLTVCLGTVISAATALLFVTFKTKKTSSFVIDGQPDTEEINIEDAVTVVQPIESEVFEQSVEEDSIDEQIIEEAFANDFVSDVLDEAGEISDESTKYEEDIKSDNTENVEIDIGSDVIDSDISIEETTNADHIAPVQ